MHKFRHSHALPGLVIKGVQSRRRAFRRFDVRVDVAICCIRLSVAQYATNFQKGNVRAHQDLIDQHMAGGSDILEARNMTFAAPAEYCKELAIVRRSTTSKAVNFRRSSRGTFLLSLVRISTLLAAFIFTIPIVKRTAVS